MIDVSQDYGVADAQFSAVGLFLAGNHSEQGRLAGAVGPDDADDAARRQAKFQVFYQQLVAEPLFQIFGLDHQVAQARPRWDDDLSLALLLFLGLDQKVLISGDPGLGLGLAGAGRGMYPFQFVLQGALAG